MFKTPNFLRQSNCPECADGQTEAGEACKKCDGTGKVRFLFDINDAWTDVVLDFSAGSTAEKAKSVAKFMGKGVANTALLATEATVVAADAAGKALSFANEKLAKEKDRLENESKKEK